MLNDIKLHGRLGRDPELTEKQGQKGPYKQVSFSIAVDRDFGDDTDWFRCVMNGARAEVIEKYFHKGSTILVSGRCEKYKPKSDPEHEHVIVKVTDFDFCDKAQGGAHSDNTPTAGPKDDFDDIDEDVPF